MLRTLDLGANDLMLWSGLIQVGLFLAKRPRVHRSFAASLYTFR